MQLATREDLRRALAERAAFAQASLERTEKLLRSVRRTLLAALLCFTFLQYYYMHVMVEIMRLPTVVTFAPPPGQRR